MDYNELHSSSAPEVAVADGVIPYHDFPEVVPGQEPGDETYRLVDFKDKTDTRPPVVVGAPRRLGMKITTFWLLVGVITFLIVGGAVGGAVGGTIGARKHIDAMQQAANGNNNASPSSSTSSTSGSSIGPTTSSDPGASTPSTTTSTSPGGSSASTTAASSPATMTPTTDCPSSNTTIYTSRYTEGMVGTPPAGAALTFTKFCDLNFPGGLTTIAEAYVYTFDACIEMCASINFYAGDANCVGASYWQGGKSPGNCWTYSSSKGTPGKAIAAALSYTGDANNNIAVVIS